MLEIPQNADLDVQLYTTTRNIADTFFTLYQEKGMATENRTQNPVNPYYHQTKTGLVLLTEYQLPSAICTPWGRWSFAGSTEIRFHETRALIDELTDKYGIEYVELFSADSVQSYRPLYAVRRNLTAQLPQASFKQDKSQYIEYHAARRKWQELTTQYDALKASTSP